MAIITNSTFNETDATVQFIDTAIFEYLYIIMGFMAIGGLLGMFCCYHYVKTLHTSQEQKRIAVRRAWQEFREKKDTQNKRKRRRKRQRDKKEGLISSDSNRNSYPESVASGSSSGGFGAARSTLRTFLTVLSQGLPVGIVTGDGTTQKTQKAKFWYKDLAIKWQKQKSKTSSKLSISKVHSIKLKEIKEVQAVHEESNRWMNIVTKPNKSYLFQAQSDIERDAVLQGLNLMLANISTVSLLQETLSDISIQSSSRSVDVPQRYNLSGSNRSGSNRSNIAHSGDPSPPRVRPVLHEQSGRSEDSKNNNRSGYSPPNQFAPDESFSPDENV